MSAKTMRDHLREYTAAARHLELAEVAINVLEGLHGSAAERCIALLKREQQAQLKLLDAAAAKLGAPYPAAILNTTKGSTP